MDYIKDGAEIYKRSFATIRAESDLSNIPADLEKVVVRMIHAVGTTDLPKDVGFSEDVLQKGRAALEAGAPVLCDAMMVANGITRARLPANNEVICTLHADPVPALAKEIGNTRTAAALDFWRDKIEGSVVVIGNAPTALFRLLELLDEGWPKPAAILGLPVGFIGAAESKVELSLNPRGVPFLTVHGRRGGSAMAVAALNAIAKEKE
ncbi:MAG: precorrin-8X methylmutase [Rhodomicrobiaceae bacterium]